MMKKYTVKEIAKIADVSVRTLHHYDEIELLKPAYVGDNNYRYYQHDQLIALMQILFYRELDFSLDEIKQIIHDPEFDLQQALEDHRHLLELKRKRTKRLLKTIDQILESYKGKKPMKTTQSYKSFYKDEINKYKDEVKSRWGHTNAYRQSMERYKSWSEADLKRIKDEGDHINMAIAETMDLKISNPKVQELIQQHHAHISNFYGGLPKPMKILNLD